VIAKCKEYKHFQSTILDLLITNEHQSFISERQFRPPCFRSSMNMISKLFVRFIGLGREREREREREKGAL
jgi:hypothetical protein